MKGSIVSILSWLLRILDLEMTRPQLYGWFHILWLFITVASTVLLCHWGRKASDKQICNVLLTVAIVVAVLEIYKQVNYTFTVTENGSIRADYQWYAFPFQFCSMPMYVGLLAGVIRKGKLHQALCAFLASYAIFAGVCVMLYPADVFISTIGINIQTMICHGSMITVGVYLLYTGHVKASHETALKAMPVFAVAVMMAAVMNEIAHATGLLQQETFNMFFISPYCEPSLPVYSLVQQHVPYPWCLIIYILAFSLAAYIILLLAIGAKRLSNNKKTAAV